MTTRQIILVAGMHRSGTSALARAINLAGIPLPSHLNPAREDNADGFWEPAEVMALHNHLLGSLGSTWSDYREIPNAWFDSAAARAYQVELSAWITKEIFGKDALLVKDPRVCRLMPLWATTCASLDVKLHTIIAVRNPIEVARSLEKRDNFPMMRSALLWLRHFLDAERFSRGSSRSFLDFDDLMQAPLPSIRRVAAELGIRLTTPEPELQLALAETLKPSFRHHVASREELAAAGGSDTPLIRAYSWALDCIAGRSPPTQVLDEFVERLRDLERENRIVYPPVG